MEHRTGSPVQTGSTRAAVGVAAAVIAVIVLCALVALMFGLNVGEIFS